MRLSGVFFDRLTQSCLLLLNRTICMSDDGLMAHGTLCIHAPLIDHKGNDGFSSDIRQ
jgi:hypothetical protein